MQAARRVHHRRNLPGLERKGGILKLLLHIALAEVAQVPLLAGAGAVRFDLGELAERRLAVLDFLFVLLDQGQCLVFCAGDLAL